MQYQVIIGIDSAGLHTIYRAGQAVTVIKCVGGQVMTPKSAATSLPVAWLAFQPLQSNQVMWTETYYAYATTTALQAGAVIVMNSKTGSPAQPGWTYTFAQGQFTSASASGSDSTFNVVNGQSNDFSFGLAQQATVNNIATVAPVDAMPVLLGEEAYFSPSTTVLLFLSSCTQSGTVLVGSPSSALAIRLSSQSPTATVGFNDATNQFYLVRPAPRSRLHPPAGPRRRS
ncbi:hypothetical protein WME76_48150 (plasmid) [Sorangium sp. So ce119]|uniref:hypothetical protein n=1 Tax=Sorangium sp. So ce119 TaxID=3133279 RepID=UPI003F5DCFF1